MSRPRILYAEDDYAHRRLLEIQLERAGFHCTGAEDGLHALELFRSGSYDLVILDLNMPGMTGIDLVKLWRSQGIQLPIFALTSDDSDCQMLLGLGFNEVLIKPLLDNSLMNLVSKHLD